MDVLFHKLTFFVLFLKLFKIFIYLFGLVATHGKDL